MEVLALVPSREELTVLERLFRIARRFAATGQLSSSPTPLIRRAFGGKPIFFVQVGSNDGQDGDPLHDLIIANPNWRGLFIEPLPDPFGRLVKGYGGSGRFIFEQIAISNRREERQFYHVPREAAEGHCLPCRFDQMGSFDRTHITKHDARLDEVIVETTVKSEPLPFVLNRHGITGVDLIHIDVEGYDYEVLKQINFEQWQPKLILYESGHLNASDGKAAISLLRSHGFEVVNCGLDTLARR
jgi:FkbM family methyltransferase